MSYHYLLDVALILLSTKVLGMLTRRFQMPQVVGALLAGVILGPAVLNVLRETEFLTQMSELGVIVIMFTAGMGTDLKELKNTGKAGFSVAVCGVIVPLVMGLGFGYLAEWAGWLTEGSFLENVALGAVLTATSVSITVETLKELGKLDTKVGSTILAAALIDDVLGLIVLTVVVSMAGEGGSLLLVLVKILLFFVFAILAVAVASKGFKKLIEWTEGRNLRRFPVLAFVLCLLMAYCAEAFFGVADIVGAFAAGLAIGTTSKAQYIQSKFEAVSYMLLTPIFFASIGIQVVIPELTAGLVWLSILLLVVALISKIIGCGLGAMICGFDFQSSLQVGVGMFCRGEVALIVANRALGMGIMSQALMTPIIITVVGGAILTPVLLKLVFHSQPVMLEANALADNYRKTEQLDIVSDQLLEKDKHYQQKGAARQ